MKLYFLSSLALAALTLTGLSQVPVGPGSVKIGKVSPAVVKTPEFQITGGASKRYKLGDWLEIEVEFESKVEELDELTFKYVVLMEKKLLDGEVTHVNIPKGRDRFSVVYVSPRSIEKLTGGKPLTGSSIENVWVEVSRNGQVIEKASFKATPMPNVAHLPGMVLNKSETPFAPLYFDRYEAIKKTR
jgi:hypothetical protein